jgi:hypothetical protein
MDASQYPITTPYGQVAGYPLNNGFHNGIDYGCPSGTPIIVNGVEIGISGATGYVTGPHLHVGRWIGGTVTNPGVGNGFKFNSATVTEINQDPTNGKYVRVQGDGASWVYLHMSDNSKVKVGQTLQGETMSKASIDDVRIINAYVVGNNGQGGKPNALTGELDSVLQGWIDHDVKEILESFYNSQEAQTYRETTLPAVYKAAETPSGVKPYTPPELFVKE